MVEIESLDSLYLYTLPQSDKMLFIMLQTDLFGYIILEIGLEYRIENYFRELSQELFRAVVS